MTLFHEISLVVSAYRTFIKCIVTRPRDLYLLPRTHLESRRLVMNEQYAYGRGRFRNAVCLDDQRGRTPEETTGRLGVTSMRDWTADASKVRSPYSYALLQCALPHALLAPGLVFCPHASVSSRTSLKGSPSQHDDRNGINVLYHVCFSNDSHFIIHRQ